MTKWHILVAILLLASALLFSGCGDLSNDAAASVNGIIITKDKVEARMDYRNKMFPGMVSREDEVNFPKIRRQTTKDMVLFELERQEAERRGISIVAADVDEAMLVMAEDDFLGDVPRMMEEYAKLGVTEAELRDATYERLLHEKLTSEAAKDVAVSEYDIQTYYEKNRRQFDQPELRQSRMIVTTSEAAALEAANRVAAGESFVEVAKQVSVDPMAAKNGGTLGLVARGQLAPEVDSVLFGLGAGQVSAPVRVADQWYVVTVESILPGQGKKTLDEAREEIRATIAKEISAQQWKSLIDGLYDEASLEFDPDYDPRLA